MEGRRETNAEGVSKFQPRATPWDQPSNRPANSERVRQRLVPNISFVLFNPVLLQKASEFVLESDTPMMLFLALDIPVNALKM